MDKKKAADYLEVSVDQVMETATRENGDLVAILTDGRKFVIKAADLKAGKKAAEKPAEKPEK